MENKICIVVPVRGDSDVFRKCVSSLLDLDYENYEIIIVDDSEKGIIERTSFPQEIEVGNSFTKGPSYARNLAAKNTDAEFLAFTDSDCIVDKNWLKALMKGFEEYPNAAACGGMQRLPQDAAEFERKVFLFMKKAGFITDYMRKARKPGIAEVNHNASCNVIYRRNIFLKEGGFLEGLWPGEDVELDYRLKKKGYKIVFNPKAVVYHYKPKDIKSFSLMMYRYGSAQGFLLRRYGVFRKIHLLPFMTLFILFLIISGAILNFLVWLFMCLVFAGIISLLYFKFDLKVFLLALTGFLYWHAGFFKKIIFKKL